MDNASARAEEQTPAPETPEDVAILYSWANLPGAKYRDFSASRREFRAQQRARVAEAQRQAELKAAHDLEEAAERELETAKRQIQATRPAERSAPAKGTPDVAAPAADEAAAARRAAETMRKAEERAEGERQEALRRQEAAEELRVRAERAQQEMLEARKRAEEQAARYAEQDAQKQTAAESLSYEVPGETTDPYYYAGPIDPAYFASTPGVRTAQATRVSGERRASTPPIPPGATEYGSRAILPYRAANQFAPSPLHYDAPSSAPDAPVPAAIGERRRPFQEKAGPQYDFDEEYYDTGRASRLFTPNSDGGYRDGLQTAEADLHIRPVSRRRGEAEDGRRPSPETQSRASSATSNQPREDAGRGPATRAGRDLNVPVMQPVFRAADGERRPTDAGQVSERADERRGENRGEQGPGEVRSTDTSSPFSVVRYEESDDSSPEDSRMFLPRPRRRTHSEDWESPRGGRRQAPGEDRLMESRESYLPNQTSAEDSYPDEHAWLADNTGEVDAAELRGGRAMPGSGAARTELPAGPGAWAEQQLGVAAIDGTANDASWLPANRPTEGGVRRRRQPSHEPIARTLRHPRGLPEGRVPERPSSGEVLSSPAWLSAERPVERVESADAATGVKVPVPDSPALPGDPDVPAPRQVARPASGLRPRISPADGGVTAGNAVETDRMREDGGSIERSAGTPEPGSGDGQGTASNDTLQQSRERVASRWFALSGLMGAEAKGSGEPRAGQKSATSPAPVLCVLSISGGVGKTSIVATLGRALSSLGEKVLLADTSFHGILPYYFGAREHRPGAARTFSPPAGSRDAPVVLVSYDADGRGSDEAGQKQVLEDLRRRANDVQRVIVDASVHSAWLVQALAGLNPWVLVPVAPDMNSVLGTHQVERLFENVTGVDGRPVKPYYVLNGYDPSMPLHLDVREVLRQFLGDRLLPTMLHRTAAVSEALAEGMTVMDYAPRAPIASDYTNLAAWVRTLADPNLSTARSARWSER